MCLVLQESFQRFLKLFQQMPAICHLGCQRCPISGTLSVFAATQRANHFNTRLFFEPLGERFWGPSLKSIHWLLGKEIDENGTVGMSLPFGPIVNTPYAWRLAIGVGGGANQSQQCVWTDWHPEYTKQTGTRFSAQFQGSFQKRSCLPLCPVSIRFNQTRDDFGESGRFARWILADSSTNG